MSVAEPIKIMRIIARLNVGGPAVHCDLLSNKLSSYGYQTILVTGTTDESEKSYEELFQVTAKNYRLVRLPRLTRILSPVGDLKTLIELIKLMRKERPVIVHTHTAKAGFIGRLAAFYCRIPVVVHTYHGHVLSGYFSAGFSKFIQTIEKLLALRTTALVTLSTSLKTELSRKFRLADESKFHIIPLGRELQAFLEAPRKLGVLRNELGLSEDTVLLGIVGRLVPIKAHDLLINALASMNSKRWSLAIIGEGPLQEELRALVTSLNLGTQIHFLGWRSDLKNIYSDLDCSIICSKNEGTPLSMIESFAAGCPVVATAVGGIPDMLTPSLKDDETALYLRCNEGILVPSQNVKALADALKCMIQDAKYRESCSIAGRATARQYSSESLAEKMAGLYTKLLNTEATRTSV